MADICIWNRCNNNCIMCTNPIGFQDRKISKDYFFEETIKRLKSFILEWRESQESINFTGGEPTTHPRFLELCQWFRKNLPKNRLVLASNGRMFSYPSFTRSFLKIKNVVIETAILGPDAKLHDAITKTKGSFRQTIKGIDNILKYRDKLQELEIRIILIKQNYKLIGKILDLISVKFPSVDRIVVIFPEPEGKCGKNYNLIGITYGEIKKELTQVIKKWSRRLRDLRLYHFPLCTLGPELWKYTWVTQRRDEVKYLSLCDKCLYKKFCCGIHKDYLKIIGSKEFKPPQTDFKFKTGDNPHHPILDIL